MLFSSENNCINTSIETIIKDKITIDNNNNINNNNLLNSNLNNTFNLINLKQTSNLLNKLDKQNLKFNQDANDCNFQQHLWPRSPSRTDLYSLNSVLLSPLEKENAKEIIQQKILDNALIAQKINEQNQELLAHYLANINVNSSNINEQDIKNNVLLSPIDIELLSKNSNNLLIENGINVNNDTYITPNVSINSLVAPEQNAINEDALFLNSTVYSPKSQSEEELVYASRMNKSNEIMNLENILNSSPSAFITTNANQTVPFISTPESTILSSPLTNSFISSPESNLLSSPELYDNLSVDSPELNLNNKSSIVDDVALDNYLISQEILKLQQESLMNNSLLGSISNQVPTNILLNNLIVSTPEITPETSPELINQQINLSESIPSSLGSDGNEVSNLKRKFELEEEEENEEEKTENNRKKSKNDNIINNGKPFIYVITESDDENEISGSEDDSQKKKKYKKKYYVCSVCNHKSKRHYNIEVHLKTHEKNRPRPFECEVCKKSFCRSHDLERHKVIHLEKMFTCELCGKKFGRLDSLKRHVGCKTCIKRQQLLKNEM